MCPVSLMHVIIALGAVPILAHVLPSTFSSFRCSVPLKAGLTGLQRSRTSSGPSQHGQNGSCPRDKAVWLPAEGCFSHLGHGSHHTHSSQFPCLVLLVVSAGSGIPPSQPKCTAGVCLSMSQPVSLDLALGSEGRELLSTLLLSQVSTQVPPKPSLNH